MFLVSSKKKQVEIFFPSGDPPRIEVFVNLRQIPYQNCYVYVVNKAIAAYKDSGRFYCNATIVGSYIGEIQNFQFKAR